MYVRGGQRLLVAKIFLFSWGRKSIGSKFGKI